MLWMFSDVIDSLVAVATSLTSQPLAQKARGEHTYICVCIQTYIFIHFPPSPSVSHISLYGLLTHLLLLPSLHFLLTCSSSIFLSSLWFSFPLFTLSMASSFHPSLFSFTISPLIPHSHPLLLSQFSLSIHSLSSPLSVTPFVLPGFSCLSNVWKSPPLGDIVLIAGLSCRKNKTQT